MCEELVFESERLTFGGFGECKMAQARENLANHENGGTIFLSFTKVYLFPGSYKTDLALRQSTFGR